MQGNPTGCMGLADYLGWNWRSNAGLPIVNVPGCPVQPDNFMETLTYLLYQAAGMSPMIPLDDKLRPTWLFGKTVHEGCDRAGYYEQADFTHEYGRIEMSGEDRLLGSGRELQRHQTRLDARHRRLSERGRHLHRMHDARFPDKFMPFMDEPPGASFSSATITAYGSMISSLRGITNHTVNKEPKWRHPRNQADDADIEPAKPRRKGGRHDDDDHDQRKSVLPQTEGLVEMNWDPITRIVGSLGIFTKIDFKNKQVAECYSTSSIFRGYSVFMKNKDPRDAHFITSRICGICGDNHATCARVYPEHGFRHTDPAAGRMDHQPR